MTEDQIKICRAFKNVTFPPGTRTKRMALDLARDTDAAPMFELSPRQHEVILNIAIKYRRQLPADVVALALKLRGEAVNG